MVGQKLPAIRHLTHMHPLVRASLAAVCVAWLAPSVWAKTGATAAPSQVPGTAPQTAEVLASYEGQNVTAIELAGQPELEDNQLLPIIQQHAHEPFAHAKIDGSIAALRQKGYENVELDVRPDADGIMVLFVLQPAFYFGIYTFPEAIGKFTYSRMLQVADYHPRGPYTKVDVNTAQQKLERFFQQSGYFEVEVKPQILVDKQRGIVNVVFHSEFGKHARFGKVSIAGASPEETKRLERSLHSWMARLRSSALVRRKPYSSKHLENATTYLNTALIKQGFLAARVKLVGADYDRATNLADIQFHVDTGPKVDAQVTGAHLWSWTKHNLLPLYQQAGVNTEIIQEGRQNLESYFEKKGFFDAQVTSEVQQQATRETVLYRVVKGPRHRVTQVGVAGNRRFGEKQLLSHVTVGKGHFLLGRGRYSHQLVRESVKNLKRVYEAEGFSTVKVTPQVTSHSGDLSVIFRVDEGPQDLVESLRVEGNETQGLAQLAPTGLKLAEGQPYSQKRVDDDRSQILAHYLTEGYLNASFRATASQTDKEHPHRLRVVYHVTEGPQVRITRVDTLGREHTRQSLISRVVRLPTEAPLREDQLLISENELYNLGIFDWSEIDPRRTITTQSEEDVLVKVHEARRNAITYGYGFEVINRGGSVPGGTVAVPGIPPVGLSHKFKTSEKTFYGPRGSFEYIRKNVRGRAESLTFSGLVGRLDQRAIASFEEPHFLDTNWSSQLSLQGEHDSQNPIFTSRMAQTGWQLERALNPEKTNHLFLRYGLRETGITRLLIPGLISRRDQHVRLSTLSASFIRDTRDNVLDAHKGIYESYQLDFNPRVLGSSVNFVKLAAQAAYYKRIPAGIVWANSLRIGVEEPFAGSHVPLSEQFFSGGGSTLRGFPLNGAGPQRQLLACGTPGQPSTCSVITVPQGGKQLLIVNSEFRVPVPLKKNLSIVGFYDGGNVFAHVGFHGQYTNSIGTGLRYVTPVGPVRVDIGHNLNAPPGVKSTQLFITLGQAF